MDTAERTQTHARARQVCRARSMHRRATLARVCRERAARRGAPRRFTAGNSRPGRKFSHRPSKDISQLLSIASVDSVLGITGHRETVVVPTYATADQSSPVRTESTPTSVRETFRRSNFKLEDAFRRQDIPIRIPSYRGRDFPATPRVTVRGRARFLRNSVVSARIRVPKFDRSLFE